MNIKTSVEETVRERETAAIIANAEFSRLLARQLSLLRTSLDKKGYTLSDSSGLNLDDVLSEITLRAWQYRHTFKPAPSAVAETGVDVLFAGWFRRVAENALRETHAAAGAKSGSGAGECRLPPNLPAPPESDPAVVAEQAESAAYIRAKVGEAVARVRARGLRPAYEKTLLAFFGPGGITDGGYPDQIAHSLGQARSTFQYRIYKLLLLVREELESVGLTKSVLESYLLPARGASNG